MHTRTPVPSELTDRPSTRFNRRSFLLRGAQSLAALVLAPTLLNGCDSGQESFVFEGQPQANLPFDTLQRLLDGPLLRPASPGFAEAAVPWNLRYADRLPAAIARCATLDDIAESLSWAQDNEVPFVTRSGGHSYSGFSTTPGLMIDISQMRGVNYQDGRVTLGPGARNLTVYDNLRPPSRAVTHGRCANVGVAGLCLGGGIGFNMRLHGLTCDQLVETDILLADGRVLTLSETQNPDLFWAVRGAGGGNFGIHTSMTFQTFAVSTVTAFNISWTDNIAELMVQVMSLLQTAPRELGIKVKVAVAQTEAGQNRLTFNILGQLVGTPAQLTDILAPLYAVAAPSGAPMIQELAYWDAQENVLGEEGAPEFSYERSRYVNTALSEQGIETILNNLLAWPGLDGAADWKIFLTGGAIADVAPDATAYVHRQAFGISSVELEWKGTESQTVIEANRQWVDDFHQAMAAFTSNQSYQNFIDASQSNFLRAYYGANLERLVQVKQTYDPGNVFHYPQSIPVSL
jgi:hypothetical protein